MTVIDCVQSPPSDALRAAGVSGVLRYLSLPQANTVWKRIAQAEFDRLRGDGFDVVLNWEYAATDWLGGVPAGQAHAAEAVKQAQALGYAAGCAIPGSCDFNMTSAQWGSAGRGYAQAWSAGIRAGGYVAGVYGPWDVLGWCNQLGGFGMFWQSMSTSWSGGRNAQQWPGAHLWQRRSGFVGGYDVDFNDQLQPWYGQYGVDAANTGDDMAQEDWTAAPKPNEPWALTQGTAGYAGQQRDTALAFTWQAAHDANEKADKILANQAAPVPVSMTDADRAAIVADLKAELAPLIPTAADIAKAVNDDAAARLQS